MLKGKLYCKNNNQCYFATARQINDVSESLGLDVISVPFVLKDAEEEINIIVSKEEPKKALFSSQNPLRIIDFLKGFAAAKIIYEKKY